MAVKLVNDKTNWVHIDKMKDGDIAIIRKFHYDDCIGLVAQRRDNALIMLGLPSDGSFSTMFRFPNKEDKMVEILKSCDTLVIE